MSNIENNDKMRLDEFRAQLKKQKLDGFIIPHEDEYLNEYTPPSAERLAFLTGFTGSAGSCVVTQDKAAIFVDGRYTKQVTLQADKDLYDFETLGLPHMADWLKQNAGHNKRIGYDPKLHSAAAIKFLKKHADQAGIMLVPVQDNPIDQIWANRPSQHSEKFTPHPIQFSGQESADKRDQIAKKLTETGCSDVFISSAESMAWLLNIRGADVPNTPLPLCFGRMNDKGEVTLYVDMDKVSEPLSAHLGNDVTLCDLADMEQDLQNLAATNPNISIDKNSTPAFFTDLLENSGARITWQRDPCVLPKACKNKVELDGMRAAHIRDGVAVTKFLAWLENEAPKGTVTELSAEEKLADFRSQGKYYQGPSFDTIAGSGPHGAVIHYRATQNSNRTLGQNELFLLDSGGQYLDGTTDITRTVAIGVPTDEMIEAFTLVLKGHIAIADMKFPEGKSGAHIDSFARSALWRAGLDYAHGTGHGVGSFLNVHEGPAGISFGAKEPLKPGMILSNEPGFYEEDEYGIRIESLVIVSEPYEPKPGRNKTIEFDTITMAPIDRTLIDESLLSADEIAWLNAYHQKVYDTLSPHLDVATKDWLKQATAPLGQTAAAPTNGHAPKCAMN